MMAGDREMRATPGLNDSQLMLARDAGDERGGSAITPPSPDGAGRLAHRHPGDRHFGRGAREGQRRRLQPVRSPARTADPALDQVFHAGRRLLALSPEIKAMVQFRPFNLLNSVSPSGSGRIPIVAVSICRTPSQSVPPRRGWRLRVACADARRAAVSFQEQ